MAGLEQYEGQPNPDEQETASEWTTRHVLEPLGIHPRHYAHELDDLWTEKYGRPGSGPDRCEVCGKRDGSVEVCNFGKGRLVLMCERCWKER